MHNIIASRSNSKNKMNFYNFINGMTNFAFLQIMIALLHFLIIKKKSQKIQLCLPSKNTYGLQPPSLSHRSSSFPGPVPKNIIEHPGIMC